MAPRKLKALSILAFVVVVIVAVVTIPAVVFTNQKRERDASSVATSDTSKSADVSLPATGTSNSGAVNDKATAATPADGVPEEPQPEEDQAVEEEDADIGDVGNGNGGSPSSSGLVSGQVYSMTAPGSGIEYYYCFAPSFNDADSAGGEDPESNIRNHHVVLLHGASFDRTVWTSDRTGILEQFCQVPGIRVSALDLPVSTDYDGLRAVLQELPSSDDNGDAESAVEPVVLVTPSASGWSMVSAMTVADDKQSEVWRTIPQYVEAWVPVAPVSLSRATDEQISGSVFSGNGEGGNGVPVLALYGNEDTSGGRISERLGRVGFESDGTVKVVELEGGHPVYLRSPVEFVLEILDFIGVEA